MTTNASQVAATDQNRWPERAKRLSALHQGPEVLLLPNAWDRLSARTLASLPGCQALASTSAGVSAALGFPDGERVPLERVLEIVQEIVEAVDLPVTVDFEAGFADNPTQLYDNVRRLVAFGVVGINLEDSMGDGMSGPLRDPAEQAERVAAAREALQINGVHGVLNARVDVLMQPNDSTESRLPEVIRRGRIYVEHGADCIFVPGLPSRTQSPEEARRDIALVVRELGCPVNLLASPVLPSLSVLRELGVRRVSTGSSLCRLAYATAQEAAERIMATGEFAAIALADRLPNAKVNRILAGREPVAPPANRS